MKKGFLTLSTVILSGTCLITATFATSLTAETASGKDRDLEQLYQNYRKNVNKSKDKDKSKGKNSSKEKKDGNKLGAELLKPTPETITADLTGCVLTEGANGYFRPNWEYKIEKGDVSDLKIIELQDAPDNGCSVAVSMKVTPVENENANFHYDVKANILYRFVRGEGWKIDSIETTQFDVVSDGKYDKKVKCSLGKDGWNVDCLKVRNTGKVTLRVGGKVMQNGEWRKFCVEVAPGKTVQVGGTLAGGHVTDYETEFVING